MLLTAADDAGTFEDYVRFHRIQMANRDVDPVYPVLREVGRLREWTPEELMRAVFVHVAYYDFGSCMAALDQRYGAFLSAFRDPPAGLKCGTERRRHRMGDNLRVHLLHLISEAEAAGGFVPWMSRGLDGTPQENWRTVTERLLRVEGNGRWAAFKTCEMLGEVCGLPLTAPDMGHANSSGPRQGLALLYREARLSGNRAPVIEQLDVISVTLVRALQRREVEASIATAETTLCDFHSLVAGRYYPGLDIDVMQEQLLRAENRRPGLTKAAFQARKNVLPEAYLGEVSGWSGPDTARKRVYRLTGEIVERG